ncbi:kelch repeat protein, partial [Teladorsagia circumcincta]
FDPAAEAWSSDIAPMSHGRWLHGVATLDGFIYAVGGINIVTPVDVVERYDPHRNQWTSVAPMGTERYGHSVSVLDECLYAVGGCCKTSANTVERFDPRVGKWEQIRPMTTCRQFFGSAVFDGHLYAAGGRCGQHLLESSEKYNPATNEWTAVADMNGERSGVSPLTMFHVHSNIYKKNL